MTDYSKWSNETLKCKSLQRVAFGALPYEKWGRLFASKQYEGDIPLREKAFSIWFGTLLDYARSAVAFKEMCMEMQSRKIEIGPLLEIGANLDDLYKKILSLYNQSEQLFLGYIRNHNVHGAISLWENAQPRRKWFNTTSQTVEEPNIPIEQYRQMTNPLWEKMPATIMLLLKRLLEAKEFEALHNFIQSRLKRDDMTALGRSIGITVNDRTEDQI